MLAKLSSREKAMLYVLLLFAIIVGSVYFLFMPMLDQHAAMEDAIAAMQALATQTHMTILQGEDLGEQIETYQAEIEAYNARLLPAMTAREADELMTGMVKAAGLRPVSLTIGEAMTVGVAAYVPGGSDDPEGETAEPTGPQATRRDIEATMTGQPDQLMALVEAAGRVDCLTVADISYTRPEDLGDYTFTLRFMLYAQ